MKIDYDKLCQSKYCKEDSEEGFCAKPTKLCYVTPSYTDEYYTPSKEWLCADGVDHEESWGFDVEECTE